LDLLHQAVIFLAAAALVVPLSKRLGFGAVLGYLVAGVIIGPSGTGLVRSADDTLHFAEIGVVLLLFVIGLELEPARLKAMRRTVFGYGVLQVTVTGAALSGIAVLLGLAAAPAVVIGFGLALSSTAFVLQILAEKKQLAHAHGRVAFGVLLFQDLAVIPMIALVPLVAADAAIDASATGGGLLGILRAVAVIGAFVVGGQLLLRPIFRLVAAAQIQEIFTATALLLVIGAAALMESLGLSMGLGAFIAGVLVAGSEYRHQLETDIEPFKGLLLGLFFMAVGMETNVALLVETPALVLSLVAGLVAVKALVLFVLARILGLAGRPAAALALILAQGGEFAFVLFNLAGQNGVLGAALVERLTLVVTLSMATTPLIYVAYERAAARLTRPGAERPFDVVEDTDHRVVIAGFGRFGQIVARVLNMSNIRFTALEANPTQVDFVRRFGNRIYYGDATRLDLLRNAHVDKAAIFVLAVDDVPASIKIADTMSRHFPRVKVYARARDRRHALKLRALGAKVVIRDTLRSSAALSGEVLAGLGLSTEAAGRAVDMFMAHDSALLDRQYAIRDDEQALIQSSRQAAQDLRSLFESDAGR
jgi:glutathione-regulated potassium-efflux system ancillary protein KefC/glutathione-regulated potassium-efflux system protein KefB